MKNHNRILVVEDDPTIAIDITLNLETCGYEVVGPVHAGEDVAQIMETEKVDLVLLDIHLEGKMTGIDVAQYLENNHHVPFIYLTSYSDQFTIERAATTFPATYIVKPFKESDLAPAIAIALKRYYDGKPPTIPSNNRINENRITPISSTEYNIIKGIWEGKTNQEIANENYTSVNTVKTHVKNIYAKLDVHSRTELLSFLRNL